MTLIARSICVMLYIIIKPAEGRSVSAARDICARFPSSTLCSSIKQRDEPAVPVDQQPQNPIMEQTSTPPSNTYCYENEKQYFKMCKKKESKRDLHVAYCEHYEATCFVTTVNPPIQEVIGDTTVPPLNAIPIPKPGSMLNSPTGTASGYMRNYQRRMYGAPMEYQDLQSKMASSAGQVQSGGVLGASPVVSNPYQTAPAAGVGNVQAPLSFLGNAGSATGNIPDAAARGIASSMGMGGTGTGMGGTGFGNGGVGWGTGIGAPFANVMNGGSVNPFQGVGWGTNVNAAGLPISVMRGVSFGGLIPFGGLNGMMAG